MADTTNQNYTTMDEGYDSLIRREQSIFGIGALNNGNALDLSESQNQNTISTMPEANLGNPVVTDNFSTSPNAITGQSVDNLQIASWIKSRNYQPKVSGFYIDGKLGRAEFCDVYVVGTIIAASGTIGGWTINSTTLSASGIVLDAGNQRISVGTSNPHIVIDGIAGTIGTSTFVSGQAGWRISGNGDAEFNNIVARGEFRTAVFVKDEVHATGGSLIVVPASILLNNFTSVSSPASSTLDLKDPPSGHAQLFAVNDIVRIKDGSGLDNWLKVTVVSDQTTFYRYTVVKQNGTNGTFYEGTAVVNYRQAADGFILLTSDMSNAPYIDIGLAGATPWAGTTTETRVGNLAGITDADFGGALSGYGIYTINGYFKGTIQGTTVIGGTIETATSGKRIRIVASSATTPTQAANSLMLINASGNSILEFGSDTSIIMSIKPTNNDLSGLILQNNSALVLTSNLLSVDVTNSSSSANSIVVGNAGTGIGISIVQSGSGIPLATSQTGTPVSANFRKGASFNGFTFWTSDGTTPNGNLSATAGDFCINGQNNQIYYCTGTTNWVAVKSTTIFGDGSDGDATISADTLLTQDTFYNNLTIQNTFKLDPGGFVIFVKGTLTFQGSGNISTKGNDGGGGNNGTDAVANVNGVGGSSSANKGVGRTTGTVFGGFEGVNGGAGGNGRDGGGSSGTNASAGGNGSNSAGTLGGNGRVGIAGPNGIAGNSNPGTTGGGAGTGGTGTTVVWKPHDAISARIMGMFDTGVFSQIKSYAQNGGAGGGGGGGNGTINAAGGGGGAGGGSGSDAGNLLVFANKVVHSGTNFIANGGHGGNGGTGGAAGGANAGAGSGGAGGNGGNGGVIVLVYGSKTGSIGYSISGGSPGTGGATGNSGLTGFVFDINLS